MAYLSMSSNFAVEIKGSYIYTTQSFPILKFLFQQYLFQCFSTIRIFEQDPKYLRGTWQNGTQLLHVFLTLTSPLGL